MKKTLILTALLGGMTAQADVVEYFVQGYDAETVRTAAYHNQMVGSMCWGANASNLLAWWQDQLIAQGYSLPKDVPEGMDIYPVYTSTFTTSSDDGGRTQSAMNWWITGKSFRTELVEGNGGYYNGLLVQEPGCFYKQENLIGSCGPGDTATLEGFSSDIIANLTNGRGLIANLNGRWSVTVWGVKYDTETKQITHMYYTDPHDKGSESKIYCSELRETAITGGDSPLPTFYLYNGYTASNGTIMDMYSLTCNVGEYLTDEAYIDRGDGAFAPHYDVQLANGKEYSLSEVMTAGGKANADVTITNGTVNVTGEGSTEGAVIFAQGTTEGERKLSVQRTGLVLSEVKVEADATLEVTAGNDVTINGTTGSGTLTKTGEGTLKGSGKFGSVIINGGAMVVGNSPGYQEYDGALTLNSGKLVFCVSDFDEPSNAGNVGWGSGTYSTINMNGNNLVIGEDGQIVIALSQDAANSLTMGSGEINLTLVTGISNPALDLVTLANKTSFELTDEMVISRAAVDPASLLDNVNYTLSNGNLVLHATYGMGDNVPEPATGTLSLLALAGLMTRRRRK